MKNQLKNLVSAVLLSALFVTTYSCKKDDAPTSSNDTIDYGIINVTNFQIQVNNLPNEVISSAESTSLVFMREEEKLARDVYITMINKWGSKIFSNISTSEQTHMDAILMLLNKYNIPDPVDPIL